MVDDGAGCHDWLTSTFAPACSWGYRSVEKFLCSSCDDLLPLYDWLYLLFIALVPLLLNSFFVQLYAIPKSTRQHLFLQHLCCLLECVLSALLSILLMPPRGTPILYSCTKNSLRDWYPIFYNPVVNHTHTLRCTQEIIFLAFHLFGILFDVFGYFRSILYLTVFKNNCVSTDPYYAALFSIPLIALFHALFAGLLYYSFGYVTLVCSLGLNTLHMALEREKSMRKLYFEMIQKPSSGTLISLFTILLIPLPSLFYLLTVGITDPKHVHSAF
ncbi:JNK1/MAPK8-associated membrane protein [Dirofilaria immitis]|nr:JNK1/MAPK8-associated membrane protein [Dirofilaria immitis]